MPSLVFVEANTTGTGMLALDRARELGLRPVFATSRPSRYRGLSERDVELVVCDTNDIDAITPHIDAADLAGIATTSEYYLATASALAAKFGVPGNPPDAVTACRDKAAVRRALAAAGVRQPRFAPVRTLDRVPEAIRAVGLPCVVKPVDESGSSSVRLCADQGEVTEHAAALLAVARNVRDQPAAGIALLEEYVTGPEYSVELFGRGGALTCVGVTEKTVIGEPWFVEAGHVFPAPLAETDRREIVDAATAAVRALGVGLGATHTEIRLTAGGPAVIEINARLAGGMIPELIRLSTGVDLLEQQLRAAAGLPVSLEPIMDGHAGIAFLLASESGVLTAVTGLDAARAVPAVERVTITAEPGTRVAPPRDAYGRLGHVIARGDTYAAVRDGLTHATAALRVHTQGDPRP